tara:strand:- start:6121 stop:6516 length:396 start_codon:yes stop_codon:yes gene_type:complete
MTEKKQTEKHARWQSLRISQFSFAINLFLSFSIASLGFAINQKISGVSTIHNSLNLIIIWWVISSSCGSLATLSRLVDFRYTARETDFAKSKNSYLTLNIVGHVSWILFGVQVLSYAIGAWYLINSILVIE